MAKPIKETPTLTGKDAENFSDQIKRPEQNRPSEKEMEEMHKNFKKLESITQAKYAICS
jgi:hypothetical protein